MTEDARLPEGAYAAETTAKVYATLAHKARRTIAASHSVIVDAVFAQSHERTDIAKAGGTAFHGLFLTADLATRLARVGGRKADPSDADAEVARRQERYDLGTINWPEVDASGEPAETLRRTRAALADQAMHPPTRCPAAPPRGVRRKSGA